MYVADSIAWRDIRSPKTTFDDEASVFEILVVRSASSLPIFPGALCLRIMVSVIDYSEGNIDSF